jgi:hypothetical protein
MHILKVPDMYIKITAAAVGIAVVMVVVLAQVTVRKKT